MAAGLKDRGFLAEGAPADVIVYDPDTVDACRRSASATTRRASGGSSRRPTGYERIIVNGMTTFIDGECTDATPGRLLRHGTD